MALNQSIALALLSAAAASAADALPAVSGVNGMVEYAAGEFISSTGQGVGGSLTLPVTSRFGFQADALYDRIGSQDFYGGAGHLFWRDPSFGLLGLAGGTIYRTGVASLQLGAEGEYYLGKFTLGGFIGAGAIEYSSSTPFIDAKPLDLVGRMSADFYPIDDLRIGAAYTSAFRNNLIAGSLEYQTPLPRLVLNAEAAFGDYGYSHWLFGARYYFGGAGKSLRERHRQDDPPSLMGAVLTGLGLYGSEYNHKGNDYLRNNPAAGGNYGDYGTYGSILTTISNPAWGLIPSHP